MHEGVRVELTDVSKVYGRRRVIESLSLTIPAGQSVGLVGPNGSGKTTLLRLLLGYLPPTRGTIRIDGISVATDSLSIRQWVGYVPEAVAIYPEWRVASFLAWCGRMRRVRKLTERLQELRRVFDLGPVWERPLGVLSKGYRQRVVIAQAMLHQPRLLVLDEPTNGLDPRHTAEICRILVQLRGRATIVWSTHLWSELEEVCDRVLVLDRGVVVADEHLGANGRSQARRWALEVATQGNVRDMLQALPGSVLGWQIQSEAAEGSAATLVVWLREGVDDPAELVTWLVERGARVRRVERWQDKLQDRAAQWLRGS